MTAKFRCLKCEASITPTPVQSGEFGCPKCGAPITRDELSKGTVHLLPDAKDQAKTVELEVIEVSEAIDASTPVEVSEAPVAVAPPPLPPEPEDEPGDDGEEGTPPFRRLEPRTRERESDIDMTPMVDVTFLLLIFFMVTASFTMLKSQKIPKTPTEDPSTTVLEVDPEQQSDFVTVVVDQYNTFQVVTVDWEKEAPNEQDLHILLREARSGDSTGTIPTKLRVEAHGESLHQKVVAAIDAGTANRFDEVQLASVVDP